MQTVIERWKKSHELAAEHPRYDVDEARAQREIANLEEMMHILMHFDNRRLDLDPRPGVIECADDGEVAHFSGDTRSGSFQTEAKNGRIVCVDFSESAVDCLEITVVGSSYDMLHKHLCRGSNGKSYTQTAPSNSL